MSMSVSGAAGGGGIVWFVMRQPHSTEGRTGVRSRLLLLLSAGALLAASAVPAADTNWLDIESRIQYSYFTEDVRSLRNLVEPLTSGDSHDRLKSYYAGLLAYRLTLLEKAQADQAAAAEAAATGTAPPKSPPPARRNDRSKNEVRQTVERCVGSLDQALEAQSNFPDALALQSACLGLEAELSSWRAPLAAPKSASQLHKALQLAPKNPRVLLLDAISEYERAKPPGGDVQHPCAKFEAVAAVFEAERADVDQVPGWGAAEAYTWLGRCYLDNGNGNAARDALERALLIAPEFGQARRLLATLTSG
jgi:tetratricopeptide (TPR) repeat protein